MKASELRLGNWVHPKFPMQVTCIYKDEILCDFEGNEGDPWEFDPKDLDGIPLSEEWLERFGFKKTLDYVTYVVYNNEKLDYNIDYIKDKNMFLFDEKVIIQYIHQLQNLIHALTGEEL
jgi:hypothetical protein